MQATPQEMGPMQFAAGSHEHDLGRYTHAPATSKVDLLLDTHVHKTSRRRNNNVGDSSVTQGVASAAS